MATIIYLEKTGVLYKLDPALGAEAQEFRVIYTSERMMKWVVDDLPELGSSWNIEESPAEQLDALVAVFASGDVLTFDWNFKPLKPIGKGVWELKTADIRVFGWFPFRDCFVAVAADTKQRILDHNLVPGYRDEVVRFRNKLDLDEPKYIEGGNPNDVVSNYTLP